MNYGTIKYDDIADGEGVRTSLFVSGCRRHCKNCFNPETWDFGYGTTFTDSEIDEIIESIKHPWIDGLTVLGGEPLEPENQQAVAELIKRARQEAPDKTIWVYSGFTYEILRDNDDARTPYTDAILDNIDILVDGPFIEEQKNLLLRFHGSDNQRIIDMPQTRAQDTIVLWQDDPRYATHSF
jgi:anaerobic ribonucleoside-triphosphate reductase activating protein